MRFLRFVDRRIWIIGPSVTILAALCFGVAVKRGFFPLANVPEQRASSFLSSISGASGGLLGLSLAALSILITLNRAKKADIRRARQRIAKAILVLSIMLMALLTLSNVLLLTGLSPYSGALLLSLSFGNLIALVVVGAAFAFVVVTA